MPSLCSPTAIRDPLQGIADLEARRLRPCSPTSLLSDPLRVLAECACCLPFTSNPRLAWKI